MRRGRTSGDSAHAASLLDSMVAARVVYSCRAQMASAVSGGQATQPTRSPGSPYALLMLPTASTRG